MIIDYTKIKDADERKVFDKLTPIKKQKFIPFIDLKDLRSYLDEYNLIQSGESKMSRIQKKRIKNVIHTAVRKGVIVLNIQD